MKTIPASAPAVHRRRLDPVAIRRPHRFARIVFLAGGVSLALLAFGTIECPADIVTSTDPGQCTRSNVTYAATASDNCPGVSYVCVPASGSTFAHGTNNVTCAATDASGNTNNCSFSVIVNDTENPTIACPANVAVQCASLVPTVDTSSVTATDNCGAVTVSWVGDVIGGQTCQDRYTITRTYQATDSSGNAAACDQLITVNDTTAPVITCPPDQVLTCGESTDPSNTSSATATDNCGGAPTISYTDAATPTNCTGQSGIDRTWTATDACGNSTNCVQHLSFADTTAPLVTCPSDVTTNTDVGLCSASGVVLGSATASDDCSSVTVMNNAPPQFPKGTNLVVWTATDACGNSSSCTQRVIVVDAEPPSIMCSPVNVQCDSEVPAAGTNASVVVSDNCGPVTVTWLGDTISGQTCPNWYTIARQYLATDTSGNTNGCTQTITVNDTTPPVAVCTNITVDLDLNGLATITAADVDGGSYDNCFGPVTLAIDRTIFGCGNIGPNAVTLTVTDQCGNSNTCTAIVTVRDVTPPVVSCPASVTANADAGQCSATGVALGTATVSDNCGASVVNNAPSSFSVGTNFVVWTATDPSANSASCTQLVVIVDNQAPSIGCPATVTVSADSGLCTASGVNLGVPSTHDNCGVATVVNNGVEPYAVGTNEVVWTVTDVHGNASSCTQLVVVVDNQAPTIACPAPVTVFADLGQCSATNVTLGVPVSGDNCGVATVVNNAAASYPVGTNAVIWTVTDIHGNQSSCTQLVVVVDNQNPTINCPTNIVTSADPGQCSKSNVTYTATATDNCTNVTVSCTPTSGSTFAIGTNSVTCTATDSSGNTNSCNFTVTVNDTQPLVVSCPINIVTSVDHGQCTKSNVTYLATASDNCTNVTLSYNPPSGSTFPIGTTTVYVNATGGSGNSAAITVFGDINTVAGNGSIGYSGDGGAATNASLNNPYHVAVDSSGNLFFDDLDNNRIRRVDAATGIITTVAGNGSTGYSGDGGAATNASLDSPTAVAVDSSGNLFIADYGNSRVRRVDAGTGIITTVAGNGSAGYSGDGGAATSARLKFIYGVVLDRAGNLFIGDSGNNRIRRVDAATGIITTVAGTGSSGYNGDGGAATNAKLFGPFGVALDRAGNLFIADWFNYRVRRVDGGTGIITTVAGNGSSGYSGDGGAATNASLTDPTGVAVDRSGNLFIADLNGQRVRRVDTVAACTFTVTVNDTEPPSIICPTNIVTSTSAGICVATNVTWTVTAADNCTDVTTGCTPASGSTFPKGTTSVVCTATDSRGNTNSCSFTVTVNDTQPPVISTCASNQTLSANGSCQAALPDLTSEVVATDNCGGTPTVTQSPAAGTLLDLGTNSVTFTVDDGRGNTNSCSFTVTVNDTQPPVISTCASNQTLSANGSCQAALPDLASEVVATDNCGGTPTVTQSPAAGTLLGLGTNSVTFTVDDGRGNTNSCTAMVIVRGVTAPTITSCPADVTTNADPGQCSASGVVLGTATASDNCGAFVSNDAPSSFPVGTTYVVWTAINASGNNATCTQQVTVVDNQSPTIACSAIVTVTIPDSMTCACGPALGSPRVSDNCDLASVTNDAPTCFSVGTNSVVWTATDVHSHSTSCTQQVVVVQVPVDSSNFRILKIGAVADDIDLTWQTFGSTTNVIQIATPIINGNHTNNYIDLDTVIVPGAGSVVSNWTDSGGATNVPSRYYRIRLQPGPSCGP